MPRTPMLPDANECAILYEMLVHRAGVVPLNWRNAMSRNENAVQSAVTRTLRAAIKVGDDYYTIEETITLPPSASDEQIQEAVATGFRIYEAQREAVDAQVRSLREHVVAYPIPVQIREPDAPASEKQRAYMDYLLKELNWDHERLAAFAAGVPLVLAAEQNVYARKPKRHALMERALATKTYRVVACCEVVGRHYRQQVGVPRSKIAVIYNAVRFGRRPRPTASGCFRKRRTAWRCGNPRAARGRRSSPGRPARCAP